MIVGVGNHLVEGIFSGKVLAEYALHNLAETRDNEAISEYSESDHTQFERLAPWRFLAWLGFDPGGTFFWQPLGIEPMHKDVDYLMSNHGQ